jgi:hypothetical protein
VAPDVLLRYTVKRVGLQNQSFTWDTGNYFLVPMWRSYRLPNSVQDPVVAPAGIGLRAGSTQRPLLDVAGPGIEHTGMERKGPISLERGI